MILLPAIDIKDGTCVRLQKGDYQTAHKVAENPLETALSFQKAGAEWIHMVDLDGAKDAVMVNQKIFLEIAQKTNLRVELERRRTGETGIFITIIFRSIRAGTYILTVLSPATRRKTIRWIPSIRFSLSLGKMGKAGICRQTCTNICPDLKPKW